MEIFGLSFAILLKIILINIVVAGILIGVMVSIPIVVYGSQLILKAMEKYPNISYAGAGILAWTAGEMIVGEPKFKPFLSSDLHLLIPLTLTVVVIGFGYIISRKKLL